MNKLWKSSDDSSGEEDEDKPILKKKDVSQWKVHGKSSGDEMIGKIKLKRVSKTKKKNSSKPLVPRLVPCDGEEEEEESDGADGAMELDVEDISGGASDMVLQWNDIVSKSLPKEASTYLVES